MRNIRMTIQYDGTAYSGFQSQANARTVQDELESALAKITKAPVRVVGAGRTDAGVHALGQVVSFKTEARMPADRFAYAANSLLPPDIRVVASEEVGMDFHARFSAKSKVYRYTIFVSRFPSAILRNYAWHIPQSLDTAAMERAAQALLGTHDFTSFSAAGAEARTRIRTVHGICWDRAAVADAWLPFGPSPDAYAGSAAARAFGLSGSGELIHFFIEADGFLYNMVRIIVGTLVEVGKGKLGPEDVPRILQARDRTVAPATAPPMGLYLYDVRY